MAQRLKDKVVIVTGASRGLGEYCARKYGEEGAIVVVAARTEAETNPKLPGTIHSVVAAIEEAGGRAMAVACNVADQASIDAMVAKVLERYGRIDVLMNNAGILPPGNLSSIQTKHWDLEIKINFNGPFYATRAVLPAMLEQKSGSVINISSVAADRLSGAYGVIKRGLEAMTMGFAEEHKGDGIAFNALKPVGAIDTPGMHFGSDDPERFAGLPKPDSYVEAATLLALATPATCTGGVFNDLEALARLADEVTKRRFGV